MITITDLKFFLSGGSGNSDPDASLGGDKSSQEIASNVLSNLFDEVSGDEHTEGDIEFRCLFVKNDSAETAYNVKFWIENNTTSEEDTLNIGLDLAGVGDVADTVEDEETAPAVAFETADGQPNALVLGNLEAGESYPIWVKRIVSAGSTPEAGNQATLEIYVDTL